MIDGFDAGDGRSYKKMLAYSGVHLVRKFKKKIDVSRLPNGIYYLNLYNQGRLIEKKTIQIRK